jgi:hypothetical protein
VAPSATAVEMELSLRRVLVVLIIALAATVRVDAQGVPRNSTSSPRTASTVAPPHPSSMTTVPVPVANDFKVRDFVRLRVEENGGRQSFRNFESSLFQTTKTPFRTQSRMPLGHAFGSRVQFNFEMTSTSNKNLTTGPLALSTTSEAAFAQQRTDDRYGISLSIPLGRGAESGASKGLLTGLSRLFPHK